MKELNWEDKLLTLLPSTDLIVYCLAYSKIMEDDNVHSGFTLVGQCVLKDAQLTVYSPLHICKYSSLLCSSTAIYKAFAVYYCFS